MKKYLPIVIIILLGAAVFYIYKQAPESTGIKRAKVDVEIEAPTLFAEFMADESAANEKYLNKVVAITGMVADVTTNRNTGMPILRLETNRSSGFVDCELDAETEHRRPEFHPGERIALKCVCMDFYEHVKLVDCVEAR